MMKTATRRLAMMMNMLRTPIRGNPLRQQSSIQWVALAEVQRAKLVDRRIQEMMKNLWYVLVPNFRCDGVAELESFWVQKHPPWKGTTKSTSKGARKMTML
jgi:hypothetical protein